MDILSLQPYYGGSHKYVADALEAEGQHNWHLLTLPPRKWQWRMRHAALTFAEALRASRLADPVRRSEAVFCSDMLNLAEFKGLAPRWAARLPAVLYFHENQFAYPARTKHQQQQNANFGFINMLSAAAADEIWFNSRHNQDSFFAGLERYIKKRPDCEPWDAFRRLQKKSRIVYPGIHPPPMLRAARQPGPLRIAWAARWEYDKGPDTFFEALKLLDNKGVDFRLRVLGEQFERCPKVFEQAAETFGNRLDAWGFEPEREQYIEWLQTSDVIVSTAIHEFFGISILEGAAAGAVPVLPAQLSYPELFAECEELFYDGTAAGLAAKLRQFSRKTSQDDAPEWHQLREKTAGIARSYAWDRRIEEFDRLFEGLG